MFKNNTEINGDLKETYKEAYKLLKQGDHFILIMIESAIKSKLSRWRVFLIKQRLTKRFTGPACMQPPREL